MTADEAKSFLNEFCLKPSGETDAERIRRWEDLVTSTQLLPPLTDFNIEAVPLSAAAQETASVIASAPAFTQAFGSGPHNFASIRLDRLIARQFYVDIEHLESLQPPPEADEAGVLEFCMRPNPIDPPIVSSDGSIVFSSHFAGNLDATRMSFDVVDEHEVRVWASIRSRPNYVYVTQVGDRFVIQNGYHRAVALLLAGHRRMPCFLRPMNPQEIQILQQQGFFDMSRIMSARPPLVSDLANSVGTASLNIRSRNHIMRVGFQAMPFDAPR
jgi:hypothetical protein